MNMRLICAMGMALSFLSLGIAVAADAPPPDYRNAVNQIKLPIPADSQTREYLGIPQTSGQFRLAQIHADIVIIEIFNMYCPHCQRHAPMTNKLFQAIQGRNDLKGRVKFIGIGVGNSPYEVGIFKKKFKILFPLFDDSSSAVVNLLPGIRTPHYLAVKKGKNESVELVYSIQGAFNDDKAFLETVLKKSGLSF